MCELTLNFMNESIKSTQLEAFPSVLEMGLKKKTYIKIMENVKTEHKIRVAVVLLLLL